MPLHSSYTLSFKYTGSSKNKISRQLISANTGSRDSMGSCFKRRGLAVQILLCNVVRLPKTRFNNSRRTIVLILSGKSLSSKKKSGWKFIQLIFQRLASATGLLLTVHYSQSTVSYTGHYDRFPNTVKWVLDSFQHLIVPTFLLFVKFTIWFRYILN